MAGTVRQRKWTTSKGEPRSGWVVTYFDRTRCRRTQQFTTKREATLWLNRLQRTGEIWVSPKERDTEYPPEIQKRLNVGTLALRLDHALTRIERLLSRIEAT